MAGSFPPRNLVSMAMVVKKAAKSWRFYGLFMGLGTNDAAALRWHTGGCNIPPPAGSGPEKRCAAARIALFVFAQSANRSQ